MQRSLTLQDIINQVASKVKPEDIHPFLQNGPTGVGKDPATGLLRPEYIIGTDACGTDIGNVAIFKKEKDGFKHIK